MHDAEHCDRGKRSRRRRFLFGRCGRTLLVMGWPMCLGVVGCASAPRAATQPAVTQPVKPPASAEVNQMKSPFLFREAKLPKGFPPAGPVGQVMVKEYPGARVAVVRSAALGKGADERAMFMPLFNHIKSHEIAMSAPVEITWSESPEKGAEPVSMAFFYGEASIGQPGADGSVEVMDVQPLKVVSIGVRGSYSKGHFEGALNQLRAWLAENPGKYRVSGPARYLGYNSPFVPWFLRYGEVQLPVVDASE